MSLSYAFLTPPVAAVERRNGLKFFEKIEVDMFILTFMCLNKGMPRGETTYATLVFDVLEHPIAWDFNRNYHTLYAPPKHTCVKLSSLHATDSPASIHSYTLHLEMKSLDKCVVSSVVENGAVENKVSISLMIQRSISNQPFCLPRYVQKSSLIAFSQVRCVMWEDPPQLRASASQFW